MDDYGTIEPNFVVEFDSETDNMGWMKSSLNAYEDADFHNFASAAEYRDNIQAESDNLDLQLLYRVRETATGLTWTAKSNKH